jgi:hypothetical protein
MQLKRTDYQRGLAHNRPEIYNKIWDEAIDRNQSMNSPLLMNLRESLFRDDHNLRILKDALLKVSLNDGTYVSLTDAKSLCNWLKEIYNLSDNDFEDVFLTELVALGMEILQHP